MKHTVLSHKESFEIVFAKLKEGKPFSFVRFGDGEYISMYKSSISQIVDSNRFFVTKELQDEIIECYNIEDENFLAGTMLNDLLPHQMMKTENRIQQDLLPDLVEREKMLAMSCLFETFLTNPGRFKDFSNELKKTSTMFICNYNHANITKVYGEGYYVKIPVTNCYATIDTWYPEILSNIDKVDKIVLSAGFSSNVVAKRLFKAGIKKIVLDVGSLSDAFIFHTDIRKRIKSRMFMKRVETQIYRNAKVLLR